MSPWVRRGHESHEGTAGVLPPGGSESPSPPVSASVGSGGHVTEPYDRSGCDGTACGPAATSTHGRCACGRRGEPTCAIDREHVRSGDRDAHDTSGPQRDRDDHMDQVAARAVALPDDVAALLTQVRDRMDALLDDAPLIALKAADALESIVASTGPVAALFLTRAADVLPMARLAELLGMSEQAAGARLAHYRQLNR
ncbi:hypothetical protein [Streptomyces sp. NPDC051921]|uniref:hypothetical protein n=1 Tax=Streptomyces sp. NPDC051921 TaxID=3155806 RepID=UPI00341BD07F